MHLYSAERCPDKQRLAQKVKMSYSQSTPAAPGVKRFVEESEAAERWNVLNQTSIYPPSLPASVLLRLLILHLLNLLVSLSTISHYSICGALGLRAKIMASGAASAPISLLRHFRRSPVFKISFSFASSLRWLRVCVGFRAHGSDLNMKSMNNPRLIRWAGVRAMRAPRPGLVPRFANTHVRTCLDKIKTGARE